MMDGDENYSTLANLGIPVRSTRSKGTQPSGGVVLDNPDRNSFRFTNDTEEFKFLEKLFKSNLVKASDRPSDFKARYEIFHKIKSDSFRTKFNLLKKQYGIATKSGTFVHLMCLYIRHCLSRTFTQVLKRCCRTNSTSVCTTKPQMKISIKMMEMKR